MVEIEQILKTVMQGVVPVREAENSGYRIEPRFIEHVDEQTFKVREIKTGKTFYRLGEEFHSVESLRLIADVFPVIEVRNQALEILSNIKDQQTSI